jgi:hypothetical protein
MPHQSLKYPKALIFLLLSLFIYLLFSTIVQASITNPIKIDQFGYLPHAEKIAIISDPQAGFNSSDNITPAQGYEVRKSSDDSVVFQGDITVWNNGATHIESNDKVWWFDFSALTEAGEYYIYDPDNTVRSENFLIDANVYQVVMKHALRSFFYQRSNFAKQAPYADAAWADSASHASASQALLLDPSNSLSGDASTARDLSGGWYDAGDYNKYVNYADGAVHELLLAYQESPTVWIENLNIPESGNGVPDLLDEVKWELDWFLKMQNTDGSVLHKISALNHGGQTSPPSTNGNQSYTSSCANNSSNKDLCEQLFYAPATASATISATAVFAHAAKVYQSLDNAAMQAYGQQLAQAAQRGWQWLESHSNNIPSRYGIDSNTGFDTAAAEDCRASGTSYDCSQQVGNRVIAAIYLYALNSEATYHNYIKQYAANNSRLLHDDLDERYLVGDGANEEFQNGLLYYASLSNADTVLAQTIRDNYQNGLQNDYVDFAPLKYALQKTDAYRAHIDGYSWGSNRVIAHAGNALLNVIQYQTSSKNLAVYRHAASGYLHYLHGTNPLNKAYLSNMQAAGAENSVNEFYHSWFNDNTAWDNASNSAGPAPGFLVGGANQYYDVAGLYMQDQTQNDALVKNQSPQKRYTDSNNSGYNTYLLSENSITYQAPYIRLLAKFLSDEVYASETTDSSSTDNNSVETPLSSNEVALNIETMVTSQWDGGYCANINVSSTVSVNNWQFQLNLSGKMGDIWLANQSDLGGNRYLITPIIWTHLIWANDSQGFGFCADGDPEEMTVSASKGHTYLDQYAKNFDDLRVDMWFTGIWDDSYCMDVNITNLSDHAIVWKEVRLALPDSQLTGNWSGHFSMQDAQLIIEPETWNSHLGLGADTTVSFCADGYNNLAILNAKIQ